jgi:hypothetical protein
MQLCLLDLDGETFRISRRQYGWRLDVIYALLIQPLLQFVKLFIIHIEGDCKRGREIELRSPRYAALSPYKGEVVAKGQWPAYITEAKHYRIIGRIGTNKPTKTRRVLETYLLASVGSCGWCGSKFYAMTGRERADGTFSAPLCLREPLPHLRARTLPSAASMRGHNRGDVHQLVARVPARW